YLAPAPHEVSTTRFQGREATNIKTFVRQNFQGIHLGAFGGHSNPHISKTTNFIFSQNFTARCIGVQRRAEKPDAAQLSAQT
ncbi:hypothetical protein, partial [Mycobacterium tuberculosis]|uniref:hypothetical protein n=1 Tax=Mycobacterium tuberculosis TaxID=1773 RepID=UPI001AE3C837